MKNGYLQSTSSLRPCWGQGAPLVEEAVLAASGLYHSSGLDDLDFITYFETAKLDDFNNLVTVLLQVKENHHNQQFGAPTLLGTIRPLDEILEILSR